MLRKRSPLSPSDLSRYQEDSRRERSRSRSLSLSISSGNSDREHSLRQDISRKIEKYERLSRDPEKSHNRSERQLKRHRSIGRDYSGSDFDDPRNNSLDMEESVDPSICSFQSSFSALQSDTMMEHKRNSGDDRLKRMEKIMERLVKTHLKHGGKQYGTRERDRDPNDSRLRNLEKMIEKIVRNKAETSTFTAPIEQNVPISLGELIPHNSSFTTSMWLNKINEECLEKGFDETTCIKFLESKMTGTVKAWYKSLTSKDFTWPELKMLITQVFPDNKEFASTLRLLVNRFEKPGETITQYYYSKMYLIEACRISGVYAVSCLIDGLTDTKIQKDARAYGFLTPESLYSQYLDKLSNHKEKDETDQPNKPHHSDHGKDDSNHPNSVTDIRMGQTNSPYHSDHGKDNPYRSNSVTDVRMGRPNSPYLSDHGKDDPYRRNSVTDVRMGKPNSPYHSDHGKDDPYRPNSVTDFRMGQPNPPYSRMNEIVSEMRYSSHPNFNTNYGMGPPNHHNFEMGPFDHYNFEMGPPNRHNFEMQSFNPNFNPNYNPYNGPGPWHGDPYFNREHSSHPNFNPYGHMSVSGRKRAEEIECFICRERGHLAVACPKGSCFKCGGKGHIKANCTENTRATVKKEPAKNPLKPENSGDSKLVQKGSRWQPQEIATVKEEPAKDPLKPEKSGDSKLVPAKKN